MIVVHYSLFFSESQSEFLRKGYLKILEFQTHGEDGGRRKKEETGKLKVMNGQQGNVASKNLTWSQSSGGTVT